MRAGVLVLTLLAAAPAQAIAPVSPAPDAVVGPFPAFQVSLGGGEESPRILLQRSAADPGSEITTRETPKGLRPYEPLEPGAWLWTPRAYRGSEKVSGETRKIVVRRIVRMDRARFRRSRASVSGSYVWRTNAPRLTHVVEVFLNGRRVSRQRSAIEHRASTRMTGETFGFNAALTDNRPPFSRIHPGTWRVRVTIKAGPNRDAASRRYVIR
jgi:hypothetical protein